MYSMDETLELFTKQTNWCIIRLKNRFCQKRYLDKEVRLFYETFFLLDEISLGTIYFL